MTKKKLEGLAAHTQESNEAFAAMAPAQKRVAIAKDVIRAIEMQQIVPEHGTYLDSYDEHGRGALYTPEHRAPDAHAVSFQDTLPSLPPCHVCAKGAIFVCAVARQNKVSNYRATHMSFNSESMSETLGGLFEPDQLKMIEGEFEAFEGAVMGLWPSRIPPSGLAVVPRACTPEDRMRLIMENIVANEGTFKPAAP